MFLILIERSVSMIMVFRFCDHPFQLSDIFLKESLNSLVFETINP